MALLALLIMSCLFPFKYVPKMAPPADTKGSRKCDKRILFIAYSGLASID